MHRCIYVMPGVYAEIIDLLVESILFHLEMSWNHVVGTSFFSYIKFCIFSIYALCWQHIFYFNGYQAKVLEPLGVVTSGSQFLEPDGNTLNEKFMEIYVCKLRV